MFVIKIKNKDLYWNYEKLKFDALESALIARKVIGANKSLNAIPDSCYPKGVKWKDLEVREIKVELLPDFSVMKFSKIEKFKMDAIISSRIDSFPIVKMHTGDNENPFLFHRQPGSLLIQGVEINQEYIDFHPQANKI